MNVYKAQNRKAVMLFAAGAVAILISLALIGYMVYILHLRTEYRAVCMEINDCVLASQFQTDRMIEQGEKNCPLTSGAINYYDMFLLDSKTIVYNRKEFSPDEKALILNFGGCSLAFRQIADGYDIGVRWETPEQIRCYTVASGNYSFQQLSAYFTNLYRRSQTAG